MNSPDRPTTRPVPADTLTDTLCLLDDLTHLVDLATADHDLPQRRHTLTLASRLRQLRHNLHPDAPPPAGKPGPWYQHLASGLGDGHALLRTAITSHLDHIDAVMDRAITRRRNPWWRFNK